MTNRALYLWIGAALFATTAAMLGAASTSELWHAFVVSEVHVVVTAVTLVLMLRR